MKDWSINYIQMLRTHLGLKHAKFVKDYLMILGFKYIFYSFWIILNTFLFHEKYFQMCVEGSKQFKQTLIILTKFVS